MHIYYFGNIFIVKVIFMKSKRQALSQSIRKYALLPIIVTLPLFCSAFQETADKSADIFFAYSNQYQNKYSLPTVWSFAIVEIEYRFL